MSKKILLIEDEDLLARMYQKKLHAKGFYVIWCTNLRDSRHELKSQNFDFVIVDNGIRGEKKTGIEFIRDIKEIQPSTEIFVLSNFNQKEFKDLAIKNGAKHYMVKMNTSPKVLSEFLSQYE